MRDDVHDPVDLRDDPATRHILDLTDGLERVMGDRDLYARMLRRFYADYATGAVPLRRALSAGERERAHLLAVTLAGAAGVLGAHDVHAAATRLEETLRLDTDAQAPLAELERQLGLLQERLGAMLHPHAAPCRALAGPDDVLDELESLLARGDGAAVDVLEESGARLRAALGETVYAAVQEAARAFDFKRALALLAAPR
ncbi:MAG TPA: hypothetical protein VFF16_20690 [Telluria sp.]|nr:hypothetical protein [Telluria sp.]